MGTHKGQEHFGRLLCGGKVILSSPNRNQPAPAYRVSQSRLAKYPANKPPPGNGRHRSSLFSEPANEMEISHFVPEFGRFEASHNLFLSIGV
jgi:hypothetical protein